MEAVKSDLLTCDKCTRDFVLKIKTKLVKEDIRLYYFRCVYCNHKYEVTYTNSLIEERNKRIKYLEEKKFQVAKKYPLPLVQVVHNRILKLINKNRLEIDNLKMEMKKASPS